MRVGLVWISPLLLWAGASQASTSLAPVGPWQITEGTDECRLMRTFGSAQDPQILRFARGSGLDSFDMVFAGTTIPRLGNRVTVTFRLLPNGPTQASEAIWGFVPGRKERFLRWWDADPAFLDAIGEDQEIEIGVDGKFVVTIHAAKAKAALRGLGACHDRLLKGWGLDTAALKALSQRAKPRASPGTWVSASDYPSDALQRGAGGTAVVLLTINTNGDVNACRIVQTSGNPSLDTVSCQMLRLRAKYHPARGQDGQPVESQDIHRIRWIIPA